MKKYLLLIGMSLLAIVGCSKAPLPTDSNNEPVVPVKSAATLKITAIKENSESIDSATVYLNSNRIGVTPLTYELDQEGTFAIRIQKPGYLIYGQAVTARNNDLVYVEALLNKMPTNKGQLLVTVNRDSCEIVINNDDGNTIQQAFGREMAAVLPSAGYFVKVNKFGFQPLIRATKVYEDSITIENLNLIPIEETVTPQVELRVLDSALVDHPILVKWRTLNATRVDIDYITNPGLNGKQEITFNTPGVRTITLTAYNKNVMTSATDTIVVLPADTPIPTAPALAFEVTPKVINLGDAVRLSWFTDGKYVIIDQGIGTRGTEGTEELVFQSSGTKTITAIAYGYNDLTTIRKDSVYVKQPNGPLKPQVTLSVSDSAAVGEPVLIEWHALFATHVDIDYLGQVGLNGKSEISFDSPGLRIISATAYNDQKTTTVKDTVIIFKKEETIQVDPITVVCNKTIAANHYQLPRVIEKAAEVTIEKAGFYKILAEVYYNSGDEQLNESFFVGVKNAQAIQQWPTDPNAGIYKVVPDDPGPAHVTFRDAGTFSLSAGTNVIQLHHYITIANQYPEFIVNGPITRAESVTIKSFRLEYVK